jgi:hypothetical protein
LGEVNWFGGAGIRPECISLNREPSVPGAKRCVVLNTSYLGTHSRVEVRLESGEDFIVHMPAGAAAFIPNEVAYAQWRESDELRVSAAVPAAITA